MAEERMDEGQAVVTRRGLIAGGAAVGTIALAGSAGAQSGARQVGSGASDRHTVGLVGRIDQAGREIVGMAALTRIEGVAVGDLFTRPPATTSTDPRASDPSAARFTLYARATIVNVSALGAVITAVAEGTADVFLQVAGGATFENPSSFARGRRLASFTALFQTDLTLLEPARSQTKLTADLVQKDSPGFRLGNRRRRFGHADLRWVMEANGRGELLEPTQPRARHVLSGTLAVADGVRR
jgi:hypothetical protein